MLFEGGLVKSPFPIILRTYALQTREELAEGGGVGEMEVVGYLRDAQLGGLQQERRFHQQHLVDIVDDGAPCDLTNHAGEIDGRDMEPVGIEGDVVMLGKVTGKQADEANEYLLHALGRLTVYDGTVLGVL